MAKEESGQEEISVESLIPSIEELKELWSSVGQGLINNSSGSESLKKLNEILTIVTANTLSGAQTLSED